MRAGSFSKDNALMALQSSIHLLAHGHDSCAKTLYDTSAEQNRSSNQFHVDFTCRVFDMSFQMDLQVRGFAYLGLKFEPS
jgi:hypothetical protein